MKYIVLLILGALWLPAGALAQTSGTAPAEVVVTATGEVEVKPDMAEITTGVITEAATAQEAMRLNNLAMATVMKTISEAKISDRDVRTSNFNLNPVYRRQQGQPARITGYRVANTVHVRIRKMAETGRVLDRLIKAGSNTVRGVSFSVANPEGALNQAREKAVKAALARAKLYARAAGRPLGRILQIAEGTVLRPQPRMLAAEAARASNVPIAGGTQTLSATVTVRMELK